MPKLMHRLYDNLHVASAFALSFTNFAYFYDDLEDTDTHNVVCEECYKEIQFADYRMPRSSAKKDTAILHSLEPGISPALRDELIARFDVTEADFRPVRTKKDEIVYYQITPQHVMLPLHETNNWPILECCPQCGSVLYDRPRMENANGEPYFFISCEALEDMRDLNVTFERFRRHFPLFVISRRLYDFLIERYPRTHYFPFFLKEDLG